MDVATTAGLGMIVAGAYAATKLVWDYKEANNEAKDAVIKCINSQKS